MTVQRSFKRLVRARMAKTGESYTAARARLLAAVETEQVAEEVPRLACSDERIRERTGRGWEEWFALLDGWGAEKMAHTALTRRIAELRGLDPLAWDVQAVAASYEWTRGTRGVGQRVGADGWVAGASRTMAASVEDALRAFVDPVQRKSWLPDLDLHQRTASSTSSASSASSVSARFDVEDGRTRLVANVEAKGPGRATVTVEHTRLSGAAERDAQKAFWRQALRDLQVLLEDSPPDAEGRG